MSESPRCPKCGIQFPADAPAGLCPKCLLQAGFENQPVSSEPQPTVSSPISSGFKPPSVEELAGKFPQLEILELLGKGGMGAVYKARQRGLDRLVAVKILPPEIGRDAAFAERFTREARALARLTHNHIVSVYDFGQADGLFFIVMEFVDGANLRQTIRTGTLTSAEALAIVPQICEALQFAHDEGIVHRDIKPENILIDKRGRVKIADFGLAKLLGQDASDHSLTATHQVMGTLRYMAPEQMQGSREVDHRADIYSLGVVFYELLTGELPMGKFAPPSKRVQVDVRLDEIVLRALEQEPEQRYQHASEVKTAVEVVSGSLPSKEVAAEDETGTGPVSSPRAGLLAIVERELRGAWNWMAGDAASPTQPPVFPVRLMILLSLAGCLMLMLPWLELHIDQDANIKQFWSNAEMPGSFSRPLYGSERWPGIAAGVAFGLLTLLLIMTPGRRPLTGRRAAVMSVIAACAVLPTFLFKPDLENGKFTIPIILHEFSRPAGQSGASSGDWHVVDGARMERVVQNASVPLKTIEHQIAYREGFYGSLALSVVLLVLSGVGIRHAVARGGEKKTGTESVSLPVDGLPQIRRQLKGPAIALMLYGLLVLFPAVLCFTNGFDIADGNDATSASVGVGMMALSFLLLGLVGLLIRGGWHMLAVQSYRAAFLGSFLGQPIGMWGLFVLSRPEVKSAFPTVSREKTETGPVPMAQLVQAPADCLILAAGIAFVTACGVALWLGVTASRENNFTTSMIRGNLIGMSVGLAIYSVLIGIAGLMLRRLRARMVVLLIDVIVGLFFPAVCALNVVMELRNIPVWPVVIPLWLGMPAALWVAVTLFRDEVRRAFDAAGERRRLRDFSNPPQQTPSIASEPRLTRLALWGAIWGGLGLMGLIVAVFLTSFDMRGPSGTMTAPPNVLRMLGLGMLIFAVALAASSVFGTMICGAVAIGHIKHSGGKLYGLPLAAANVLLFPMLILGFAASALTHLVQIAIWTKTHTGYVYKSGLLADIMAPNSANRPDMIFLILDTLVALLVCFFVGRALWRAIAAE